jgi:hypothetical protein
MTRSAIGRPAMRLRAIAVTAVFAVLALMDMPSARLVGQNAGPLTGALLGTVVDSSGTPVAAASVRVVGADLRVTNDVGRFLFPELPPGTTELSVSAPGYRSAVVPGVAIRAGETTRITVTLSRTR